MDCCLRRRRWSLDPGSRCARVARGRATGTCPDAVDPARVGRAGVVDDAVLECEGAHAGQLARVRRGVRSERGGDVGDAGSRADNAPSGQRKRPGRRPAQPPATHPSRGDRPRTYDGRTARNSPATRLRRRERERRPFVRAETVVSEDARQLRPNPGHPRPGEPVFRRERRGRREEQSRVPRVFPSRVSLLVAPRGRSTP
jgi:hypothetical protein